MGVYVLNQQQIDALRAQQIAPQGHWIDGNSVGLEGEVLQVTSPIDGSSLTSIAAGDAGQLDEAVASAKLAFDDGRWSKMPPATRKMILHKVADLIAERAGELAVLGVRDNGSEIAFAQRAEPGGASATFRFYAECVDKVNGEITPTAEGTLSLIHKEPVGVVGAIVPWNTPLSIAAWKVAPALALGNSVVVKPSEVASLTVLKLAEICSEAGLPDGVFNVVTGEGAVVGRALGLHPDVSVLSFTGSGATGRRLLEYAAHSNLKRVYLELGGKSPNIVFEDTADLDKTAKAAAGAIFRNSGQICIAGSRLLVQRSIFDDFVQRVVSAAEALKVGDPLDLNNQIGAVASAAQLAQIEHFVETATGEGASLLTGGQVLSRSSGGNYYAPTLFTGVTPDSTLAQQEVFGPVVAAMPFDDEAEAIRLANDSQYGLAAGIWTENLGRAHRMIAAVKAGAITVNGYGGTDITAPLGGHKQSGNGVDKSLHALDKYCDLKLGWVNL